jgi:hypothetical protein
MDTATIGDLIIAVDYGMSLRDMIAAGKYDWVNPSITAERFPVEGTGKRRSALNSFTSPATSPRTMSL